MRTWVAVALLVAGIASIGLAYSVAKANHAFDGCVVSIQNQTDEAQAWNLTFRGATRSGVLAAHDEATIKLCTFGPRDAPEVVIHAAKGEVRPRLDPVCSDPLVEIRPEGLLVEARTCE